MADIGQWTVFHGEAGCQLPPPGSGKRRRGVAGRAAKLQVRFWLAIINGALCFVRTRPLRLSSSVLSAACYSVFVGRASICKLLRTAPGISYFRSIVAGIPLPCDGSVIQLHRGLCSKLELISLARATWDLDVGASPACPHCHNRCTAPYPPSDQLPEPLQSTNPPLAQRLVSGSGTIWPTGEEY